MPRRVAWCLGLAAVATWSLTSADITTEAPPPRPRAETVAPVTRSASQTSSPTPIDSVNFPSFDTLQGHVDFWTSVFGVWSRGQVAVHDLEYPGVVYEVVDLPGPMEDRYTDEQIDFVEELNERWQDRLEQLEQKVARRDELTDEETSWVLLLATRAGNDTLRDAHERVRTQRGLRERFRRGIEISFRYVEEFRQIFREAGLPEDLAYLPHVESSFQARARSSAGAVGIWQFTRGTGRRFMTINAAVDERLDPIASAHAAADYLASAYDKLQDWPIALTSYNHGVAGMQRAVNRLGRDYERIRQEWDGRYFGFASKNFYAEFLAARAIAADVERYFPEGVTAESRHDLESFELESRSTVDRLAEAFEIDASELAAMNPAWSSRAVRSGYALPEGLSVWLPPGTLQRVSDNGELPDYSLSDWIRPDGSYVVRPGDTLSTIAATYGIRLPALREMNGIPSGSSLIRVGQRLLVPGRSGGSDTQNHTVRHGESLSSISQRYGTTIAELRALNGMPRGASLIRVGQKLAVRAGDATVHVVRSGDSLLRIALRYRVRLTDLLVENKLSERSIIHPGQRLRIPATY